MNRSTAAITAAVTVSAALLVLTACTEPSLPIADTSPADTGAEAPEDFDPLGDALSDAIDTLTGRLNDIHALLATDATAAASLRDTADDALDLLLYADDAVFPSPRETAERDATGNDLLSVVLTSARQKGGTRADMVTSAVRDTLTGDLGAWERDPVGMRQTALAAAGPSAAVTAERVQELEADGMRAIAWIAFARTQQSPETIRNAFMHAQTHLEIVTFSVQLAATS